MVYRMQTVGIDLSENMTFHQSEAVQCLYKLQKANLCFNIYVFSNDFCSGFLAGKFNSACRQ